MKCWCWVILFRAVLLLFFNDHLMSDMKQSFWQSAAIVFFVFFLNFTLVVLECLLSPKKRRGHLYDRKLTSVCFHGVFFYCCCSDWWKALIMLKAKEKLKRSTLQYRKHSHIHTNCHGGSLLDILGATSFSCHTSRHSCHFLCVCVEPRGLLVRSMHAMPN